ncbi:MAG: glutamate synthase subunit beta [Cyclobacteriaceae bacterium]|nr:glutamate synthase subunit beta [Cyclobacteriaceae bacterium]
MGKPTGFLEIERIDLKDELPLERVKHWDEFHAPMAQDAVQSQAARCMDCGVPFCHTGANLPSGASGCPVYNLIPDWNDMLYKGQWEKAFKLLFKTNNFPEFTGRVCPAPCEGACVLGIHEPPVTIKNHEYSIIEHAFEQGWVAPRIPKIRTGKKVAIIGSGPAGLAAADELNQMGHSVTIFERADRAGGLLMYGIPNMKLDKQKVVERRLQIMQAEGVEIRTGVEVGKDVSVANLKQEFDSTVLATGSTIPRDLLVEGRDLEGVHFAMKFLTKNTKSLLDSNHSDNDYINAKDKNVVVIGGGDTGTDCVATALRHGCASVQQLEIMPMPPETRADDNPWPEYPKIYKLDYGQQEAKAKQGVDPRKYEVMTKRFEGQDGKLTAVITTQIEWVKKNGRFVPQETPATEKIVKADLVFLAMGFTGPEQNLLKQAKVNISKRGNIEADYGKFTTSVPGIFAAGDCRRGQSLVVWAINEGRAVAKECDRYLVKES